MAIGVGVASKVRANSGTSVSTTGVTTQASGSAILIGLSFTFSQTFSSLADSKSNSYTQIGTEATYGTGTVRFYYKENAVGGASHTATLTTTGSSSGGEIMFLEITGGLLSGILDQSGQRQDSATPFTLAAGLTTTQAAELLATMMFGNSGSNPATHAESGLGSSTIQTSAEETNGASFVTFATATSIKSSTGTFNPSWTESGGTDSYVLLATFKEAATGAVSFILAKRIYVMP